MLYRAPSRHDPLWRRRSPRRCAPPCPVSPVGRLGFGLDRSCKACSEDTLWVLASSPICGYEDRITTSFWNHDMQSQEYNNTLLCLFLLRQEKQIMPSSVVNCALTPLPSFLIFSRVFSLQSIFCTNIRNSRSSLDSSYLALTSPTICSSRLQALGPVSPCNDPPCVAFSRLQGFLGLDSNHVGPSIF